MWKMSVTGSQILRWHPKLQLGIELQYSYGTDQIASILSSIEKCQISIPRVNIFNVSKQIIAQHACTKLWWTDGFLTSDIVEEKHYIMIRDGDHCFVFLPPRSSFKVSNCTVLCNVIFFLLKWVWYRKKYRFGTGIEAKASYHYQHRKFFEQHPATTQRYSV